MQRLWDQRAVGDLRQQGGRYGGIEGPRRWGLKHERGNTEPGKLGSEVCYSAV